MTDKECPVTLLAEKLPYLISVVQNGHAVELTQNGGVVAVLVSPHDYWQLKQIPKYDIWEAIQNFRTHADFSETEDDEDVFLDVRDRSPAREVVL
jgi:antitoxin (DNA-binding transcriptional repressor) of toxin-antitoxin stability system